MAIHFSSGDEQNHKAEGFCAKFCFCYYRCCRPWLLRLTGGCSAKMEKEITLPLPEGVSAAHGSAAPKRSLLSRCLRSTFRLLLFCVIALQVYVFGSWYCGSSNDLLVKLGIIQNTNNSEEHYSSDRPSKNNNTSRNAQRHNKSSSEETDRKYKRTTSNNISKPAIVDERIIPSSDNNNNSNHNEEQPTLTKTKPAMDGLGYTAHGDPLKSELPWITRLGEDLFHATQKKKVRHPPRYRYKPPKVMIKSYGAEIDAMKFVKNAVRTTDFLGGEDFNDTSIDKDELVDPKDPRVKELVAVLKRKQEKRALQQERE